jgi:hypothetical protein
MKNSKPKPGLGDMAWRSEKKKPKAKAPKDPASAYQDGMVGMFKKKGAKLPC